MANPFEIVGDDGQSITLGDGTKVPKAALPADVMQAVGIAPVGQVSKPGLVIPNLAPGNAPVDLSAGKAPTIKQPPLLGQGGEQAAGNGTALPVATPIGAPGLDAAMQIAAPVQQPTSQTVEERQTQFTSGVKTSPQDVEAQRALAEQEKTIGSEQLGMQAAQAAEEAKIIADARLKQDAQRVQFAEKQQQLDTEIDNQRGMVDVAVADYRNTSANPERNVFADIANVLAPALGAIGSSLTGGPNIALDIVNKGIDRKIAAQRAELDKKKANVDLQKNQLAWLESRGLSSAQAETAARQMAYEDVANELRAKAAQYKNPQLLKQADQLALGIDQRLAGLERAQHEAAQGRATTIVAEKTRPVGPGLDGVKDLTQIANQNEEIKAYRDARRNADNFADLRKSGADGAAVSDFIANGLKQGSFNENFVALLKKRGVIDKAGEFLREKYSGGYEGKFLDEIQGGLNNKLGTAAARAKPAIQELVKMGLNPALIVGGQSRSEVANGLGLTPRN